MAEKEKDPLKDYLKLKDKLISDQLTEVFLIQPENWRNTLEEIGF